MVRVIYETDMTFDVDDVGALAVLHALADQDEAEILGISYNEVHPQGPQAIQVINSWYGRSHLPIGTYEGTLINPDRSRYLKYVAQMPADLKRSHLSDSVDFYSSLLKQQEDQSVTIVSVGFLNNLAALLRKHPDLVRDKVVRLIVMGGLVNDNFNFVRHELVLDTQFVIEQWPSTLVVTDLGGRLYTGVTLANSPTGNPIREAYFRWFDKQFKGRSSWDQIAVLIAVRGESAGFRFVGERTGRLRNGFEWQLDGNSRAYAQPTQDNAHYVQVIEHLMTVTPRSHTRTAKSD